MLVNQMSLFLLIIVYSHIRQIK